MATIEQNDSKILALKDSIAQKKKDIGKVPKFSPTTNCVFTLNNVTYNLNAQDENGLIYLGAALSALQSGAQDFGYSDFELSGWNLSDWILDIKGKLAVLAFKKEEVKLKAMEARLEKLLSSEKQTELILSEIEGLLK